MKIKAIIVDDETIFRIGMMNCVDWQKYHYVIVGQAADGQEAFELVKRIRPDVVFTDVRMPNMDGLQLTKRIMEYDASIKVVILSCHNEFNYVREALKLGAYDYVLKLSMKPSDVQELIVGLYEKISEEKEINNQQQHVISTSKENLVTDLLEDLVFSPLLDYESAIEQGKLLGLDIVANTSLVLSVNISHYSFMVEKYGGSQLFAFTFSNIIEEVIDNSINHYILFVDDNFYIIMTIQNQHKKDQEVYNLIKHTIAEINRFTQYYIGFTISVGVSTLRGRLIDLKVLIDQANQAKYMSFYEQQSSIYYFQQRIPFSEGNYELAIENTQCLLLSTERGDKKQVTLIINQIVDEMQIELRLPNVVKSTFKEIIFLVNQIVRRYESDIFSHFKTSPLKIIEDSNSIFSIREYIIDFLSDVIDYITDLRNKKYRPEIVKVINHINENIVLSHNLKEISEMVNFNEKYFCKLFKQEVGVSFTEYVTRCRIEKAKELLKYTDKKTYEIAYALGFEYESYFTKLFKKHCDLTPLQFRKKFR